MDGVSQMTLLLATTLAGVAAVPILQVAKRYLHLKDTPMVWMAAFLSVVIGCITVLITGEASLSELLANPLLIIGSGGVVGLVSNAVYRTIKEKLGLGGE
jgi:hypothetical protein